MGLGGALWKQAQNVHGLWASCHGDMSATGLLHGEWRMHVVHSSFILSRHDR